MASSLLRISSRICLRHDGLIYWLTNTPKPVVNIFYNRYSPMIKAYSSKPAPNRKNVDSSSVSLKEKLKKAVAQYGSTVIVFHVTISLASLGICYLLVSSGLEVAPILERVGVSDAKATKIVASAGTFAVAYAVHKIFAPARIMITLTTTPFIVRYLRQVGFLKKNVKK